ncbi:MAG: UDP-N-acetylmuramate--L-alanine ligase [Bacteroidetes bacterium]|nr:UDP-N-acetylmuramate--L-alanine ligase [Bacteroidota bacterium]
MPNTNKNIAVPDKKKTVHFIGIGGIGMCGLAEYLLVKGYRVSGSDITRTAITDRLVKKGAKIKFGHKASNVGKDTGFVVYTSAVKEDNPELKAAVERDIKTVKRAALLGGIVNDKILIAVSGTHGKTSTTSMIAKILIDAKYDPTVFVGGNLDFLGGAAYRIGKSRYAVVEADEYDRSFHTLKPKVAVINNIELDHTDIYRTEKDIIEAFNKFADNTKDGYFVVNWGDRNIRKVMKGRICRRADFGKGSMNRITSVKMSPEGTSFKLNDIPIKLSVIGKHNIYNAAAAFIAGSIAGIKASEILKSLESYPGVKRRLELKYSGHFTVYDDYAHHPTEVASSLESLGRIKKGRLIVVYQPHTYTRTREFYGDFAKSLETADIVYLMPVYPARELPIKGVTSRLIYNGIRKSKAKLLSKPEDVFGLLKKQVRKGDIVVFQGAGDVTNYCAKFVKEASK